MDLISILLAVYCLLQLLDGFTTWKLLAGGGKELNPVMVFAFKSLGTVLGLIVTKVVFVAVGIYLWWANQLWILGCLDCIYLGVVVNNSIQLVLAKK